MNTTIYQHIVEAMETVADIPDDYRKIAFEVILQHLLKQTIVEPERKASKLRLGMNEQHNALDIILKSDYNWASSKILNLKPVQQNLAILKIAREKFNIDGLTPNEIKIILTQKFRIIRSANAISMSLMEQVGKRIDRISEGKQFRYRITDDGSSYIDSEIQKLGI